LIIKIRTFFSTPFLTVGAGKMNYQDIFIVWPGGGFINLFQEQKDIIQKKSGLSAILLLFRYNIQRIWNCVFIVPG
jgi:hypothetical protein